MAHGATVFADSVCSSSDVDTCRWVGRWAGRYFRSGRPLLPIGSAVISDRVGRYFGLGRPLFRIGSAVIRTGLLNRHHGLVARRESSARCTKSGTYAQRHLRHSRRRRAQQAVKPRPLTDWPCALVCWLWRCLGTPGAAVPRARAGGRTSPSRRDHEFCNSTARQCRSARTPTQLSEAADDRGADSTRA